MQNFARRLPTLGHSAAIGIIRRAGGYRQHAGTRGSDLVLGRSRGSLAGSSDASKNEGDNESANNVFHG
jgi:hypothetical protein